MNLKLNESRRVIFIYGGKEYLIVSAEINGNYIVVTTEDGKRFVTHNNEENIKILKENFPEALL